MDIAMCTEDGVTYTAVNFSRLLTDDIDRKRRLLQCPECGGPAFFRNSSPIGRGPCFGARPHAAGCGLAAQDFERLEGAAGEDAPCNHGCKIVVDFNYGAPAQTEYVGGSGLAGSSYGQSHSHLYYRRLSSLLRTLIKSPSFGNSDHVLMIDGHGEIAARDFFVPLLSVTAQYIGQFRGFWGLISDVRLSEDKSTVWFNSGGLDTISFCLDTKFIAEFNQRYRVRDEEDLAGAYILVIGTLQVSPDGKIYCVIQEPDFMAFRLT